MFIDIHVHTTAYPAPPRWNNDQKTYATAEELLLVSGVGKHKLGKYGHEFLREITGFASGTVEGGENLSHLDI